MLEFGNIGPRKRVKVEITSFLPRKAISVQVPTPLAPEDQLMTPAEVARFLVEKLTDTNVNSVL